MKKIFIFSVLSFFYSQFAYTMTETLYFKGVNQKYYCDSHAYDVGYKLCTKEQLKSDTLVAAGFNGSRYMNMITGKLKRNICVENGKQVNIKLCAWKK